MPVPLTSPRFWSPFLRCGPVQISRPDGYLSGANAEDDSSDFASLFGSSKRTSDDRNAGSLCTVPVCAGRAPVSSPMRFVRQTH